MTDAARRARNAYKLAWAHAHPDKVKEIQERFWEKRGRELEEQEAAAAEMQEGLAD